MALRVAASKRPYLREGDRRRQLLAVATEVVRQRGLGGLTMAGIASAAGVSRQLVHSHFPTLTDLTAALVVDRFGRLEAAVGEAIAAHPGDLVGAVRDASRRVLELRAEDRRVLRALVAETSPRSAEIAEITDMLRARMAGRWARSFPAPPGRGVVPAAAVFWALTNALFGLADLVDDGSLEIDDALGILEAMARGWRDRAGSTSPPATNQSSTSPPATNQRRRGSR